MKNQEEFVKIVNDSASIKYDLNEFHMKQMTKASKIFSLAFRKNRKEFVDLKNSIYYKGGYPNESTPSKLYSIFLNTSIVIKYYTYLNREAELQGYLDMFNIEAKVKNHDYYIDLDEPIRSKEQKKVKKLYNQLFNPSNPEEVLMLTKKDLLNKLLDFSLEKTHVICTMSDSIKLENAKKAEEECEISKTSFLKTVNIKYKDIKQKKIDEDIKKINDAADNIADALSIFNK